MKKEKRKIAVVIINRTNYARLKSVLTAIKKHPRLKLQLIVGSSLLLERFGKGVDIIKRDGFSPDADISMNLEGENPLTMAKSVGIGLMEFPAIFTRLKPDMVLVNADRFETIAGAVAASYMNIIVVHTLGGEVTGSIDESVRHAVTKFAHLHFPAHKIAAQRIIRMGEDPKTIFAVGNSALDIINKIDLELNQAIFWKKYGGVGLKLNLSDSYLLVIQHPVTTEYSRTKEQIKETLDALEELKMQTILLWPNIDAGSDDIAKAIRVFRECYRPSYIHFFKNFSVEDYLRILKHCTCILGNSSSGIIEAGYMGVPAVNIGTRQQGRKRGENVIDVPYKKELIIKAIKRQINHGPYKRSFIYGRGDSGEKIAEILATIKLPDIQKRISY